MHRTDGIERQERRAAGLAPAQQLNGLRAAALRIDNDVLRRGAERRLDGEGVAVAGLDEVCDRAAHAAQRPLFCRVHDGLDRAVVALEVLFHLREHTDARLGAAQVNRQTGQPLLLSGERLLTGGKALGLFPLLRAQGVACGARLLLRGLLFLLLRLKRRQMLGRGGDGVFLIEQLLRFIRQERDARAALGQRAALRALFGEQLRVRALGLAGGGRVAVDLGEHGSDLLCVLRLFGLDLLQEREVGVQLLHGADDAVHVLLYDGLARRAHLLAAVHEEIGLFTQSGVADVPRQDGHAVARGEAGGAVLAVRHDGGLGLDIQLRGGQPDEQRGDQADKDGQNDEYDLERFFHGAVPSSGGSVPQSPAPCKHILDVIFTQTLPIEQPDAEVQIRREQQPEQIRRAQPRGRGIAAGKIRDHEQHEYDQPHEPEKRRPVRAQQEKQHRPQAVDSQLDAPERGGLLARAADAAAPDKPHGDAHEQVQDRPRDGKQPVRRGGRRLCQQVEVSHARAGGKARRAADGQRDRAEGDIRADTLPFVQLASPRTRSG